MTGEHKVMANSFYIHLTGSTQMDEEIHARVDAGEDLVHLQETYHRAGFRQGVIVRSLKGYTVRHVSGLDGWGIISKGHETFEAALVAGARWVNEAPNLRNLIVQGDLYPGESPSQV